jgi:hypothetical protein
LGCRVSAPPVFKPGVTIAGTRLTRTFVGKRSFISVKARPSPERPPAPLHLSADGNQNTFEFCRRFMGPLMAIPEKGLSFPEDYPVAATHV